ncbi:response regulator [Tsukamurella paurometabola]|uniref:Response regulator transcription factor n=1 Tax=Tsukamurella paurometabola TaxID=2061 RepID=A0ABS5NJB6_TSUPA|nr:response regulator transcription factor [Tsukamurella paurometabola]MBS4104383.1 response regulator transcription factor [Tsukamurella paurometabola]
MTVRVVLVDDQELVRKGMTMVLEGQPGIAVVGEADDGTTALDLLTRIETDVVVMDVRMPHMSGVETTRRLRAREGAPKVLILTTFDLDEYAYDALQAGASGFLLKDTPVAEVAAAIRHIDAGDAVVAPSTTRRLLDHFTRSRPTNAVSDAQVRLGDLTRREHEVLGLVARGLSNAEIAAELVVAEGTVKVHVGRILAKLNLRDRVQAVVLAYESGFVDARGR